MYIANTLYLRKVATSAIPTKGYRGHVKCSIFSVYTKALTSKGLITNGLITKGQQKT